MTNGETSPRTSTGMSIRRGRCGVRSEAPRPLLPHLALSHFVSPCLALSRNISAKHAKKHVVHIPECAARTTAGTPARLVTQAVTLV